MKIKITITALIISIYSYSQCKSGDCDNGTGIYEFAGGAYFKGEFKNGEYIKGKYHFSNGDIFKGTFLNTKLNGPNCEINTNNQKRSGTFKEGELISGIIILNEVEYTDSYEGTFDENSKLKGEGTFTRTSNKKGKYIRKGNFINGVLNDNNGYILYFDKRYYEGEVKDNKPNGEGKITFPTGGIQEGIFLDGLFQRGLNDQKNLDNLTKVIPITFNPSHGVYYMDITISGNNFETVFDTGAFGLLLDEGYLYNAAKKGEIEKIGTETTRDANNNEVIKDKYNIKSVMVGDIELKNVEAMGNDIGKPSLFGVGALKELGSKFILDFENNQINIIK